MSAVNSIQLSWLQNIQYHYNKSGFGGAVWAIFCFSGKSRTISAVDAQNYINNYKDSSLTPVLQKKLSERAVTPYPASSQIGGADNGSDLSSAKNSPQPAKTLQSTPTPGQHTVTIFKQLAPVGRFSPIYYDATPQNGQVPMASVNAGDHQLYVGGGGINQTFGQHLTDPGSYQAIHNHLAENPKQQAATYWFDAKQQGPLKCSTVYPDNLGQKNNHTGTVFIDVFKDVACPNRNLNNRAMVYVVPPKRSDFHSDNEFLNAVEKTARNVVVTLEAHNTQMMNQQKNKEVIPALRLCGFSSSGYAGNVPANVVTSRICNAVQNQLQITAGSTITEVHIAAGMQPGNIQFSGQSKHT